MNILIAGGTGSFGHAFLSYLNSINYKSTVRVFSRDEAKHITLNFDYPDLKLESVIGDIRDLDAYVAATKNMDVVIHAAALKHVPIGELFTEEAIKTNTLGALNCVKACEINQVKKAIYLSTDKAVYPINAYGMSKALGEKLFQSKASREVSTTFCITRYGNVLGSRGSILPILKEKMKNKDTIRITDFAMTRFVMNLDEAVSLVSFAIDKGLDGQMFIKKVNACDLKTLVNAYLKLHFDTDIDEYGYELVGVRPGEKIHEMLATAEELSRARELEDDILCVEPYHQAELYRGTLNQRIETKIYQDLSSDVVELLKENEVIDCIKAAGV